MAWNDDGEVRRRLRPVSPQAVRVHGGFWGPRLATNREVTVGYLLDMCDETGRTGSLRLDWEPRDEPVPHHFWDSDVAKSIEAVAYVLMAGADPELERRADEIIELFASAQQADGYLNSYFLQVEPDRRWTNLRDSHELYCAGHLMEAAVAYYAATAKDRLLEVVTRYAEHIDEKFGPGKRAGYPGHEEIELALVKLYRTSGDPRHLELAKAFIDRRGTEPKFFRLEARERGDDRQFPYAPFREENGIDEYWQAHLPVREQSEAVGHSVRAGYLYTGMADVAAETGDGELLSACRRLWRNIVDRRMYVTGGIGSHRFGERFSADYDLPNEEAYAESCAAISLALFAQRLLSIEPKREYGDVLERVLYNGVLAGISLDGTHFFYANPLAAHPVARKKPQVAADPVRQEWYGCACCPPNLSRVLGSLGSFAYATSDDEVWLHLFVNGSVSTSLNGVPVRLSVTTDYPWNDRISIAVEAEKPVEGGVGIRIPGWCKAPTVEVKARDAGSAETAEGGAIDSDSGYWYLRRRWITGDRIELVLPMEARRLYADPRVRQDAYQVAFRRGPLVYCFEEVDNGADLAAVAVSRDAEATVAWRGGLFDALPDEIPVLEVPGVRRTGSGRLYDADPPAEEPVNLLAIPYAFWAHRGEGEMRVWLPQR